MKIAHLLTGAASIGAGWVAIVLAAARDRDLSLCLCAMVLEGGGLYLLKESEPDDEVASIVDWLAGPPAPPCPSITCPPLQTTRMAPLMSELDHLIADAKRAHPAADGSLGRRMLDALLALRSQQHRWADLIVRQAILVELDGHWPDAVGVYPQDRDDADMVDIEEALRILPPDRYPGAAAEILG